MSFKFDFLTIILTGFLLSIGWGVGSTLIGLTITSFWVVSSWGAPTKVAFYYREERRKAEAVLFLLKKLMK